MWPKQLLGLIIYNDREHILQAALEQFRSTGGCVSLAIIPNVKTNDFARSAHGKGSNHA